MIVFTAIAATCPSDTAGMARHLLNNTLAAHARTADRFANATSEHDPWSDLARQVLDGTLTRDEAITALMRPWLRSSLWDPEDIATLDRVRVDTEDRFDRFLERLENGLEAAPLATIRPDIEAGVMLGLGIRPGMLLTEQEISSLLAGRRVDGSHIENKVYATERTLKPDPRTGQRRWATPIGSYDFCTTPDKSVSVAWAFASDVERAKIFNAHMQANREAIGYIADEIAVARSGQGSTRRESGAAAIVEFTHHTAKRVQIVRGAIVEDAGQSGDMDLHTHNLIPNAVFTPSGRVGGLDTLGVKGLIKEAGDYYQARLGTLLRDQGFDTALDPQTHAVRMSVIPASVCEHFSKRHVQGLAWARQRAIDDGLDWDTLSPAEQSRRVTHAIDRWEIRQKGSRGARDDTVDFDGWREQAAAIGWTPSHTLSLIGPPLRELTRAERHRAAYELALPWLADRFEHSAVLPHFDLRRAALHGLKQTGMADLADVDAVTRLMREEGILQYGEHTALRWVQEPDRRHVSVTTVLHEQEEQEFMRLAAGAASDRVQPVQSRWLDRAIHESGLDFTDTHGQAQRRAIERIAGGSRFSLLIASAGAGKTASLTPLVAAWKAQHREVHGASLAWRQADDLVSAGIPRANVHAFSVLLKRLDIAELALSATSVVAIDEWGLLGTRQGLHLLRHQNRIGFTIVALGDPKQCQSPQAGDLLDLSVRALGPANVPVISTTRRQQGREAEIVSLLRSGRAAEAIAMKRDDNTAEMIHGGRDKVIARIAELYLERLAVTGKAPAISAPTNADAHQISAAIRERRQQQQQIGPDLRVFKATDGTRDYALPLAQGDRVRLFKSTSAHYIDTLGGNRGSIGRNGSVLEVVGIQQRGLVLRTRTGRTGIVSWAALTAPGGRMLLGYGDAMTIHSAQGITAREHIFALPSGSRTITGHTGYSAATRHRETSWLITSEIAERIAVRESRPVNSTHEVTLDDKWANVATRLAWQSERDTATALRERAGELRQGTIRAFHALHAQPDPRLRKPLTDPEPARELVQRRKWDLAFAQTIGHVRDRAVHVTQTIRRVRERFLHDLSR